MEITNKTRLKEYAYSHDISCRTMQRRLQKQGITFQQVKAFLLCSRAMNMFREGATVTHVAQVLQYSEIAAFTRSFKRWTGQTCSEFRRERSCKT